VCDKLLNICQRYWNINQVEFVHRFHTGIGERGYLRVMTVTEITAADG